MYNGVMKKIIQRILATSAAAALAVGIGLAAAPAANASPGDYVINGGGTPLILVIDGGQYTYAYYGDTYDYVSYIAIPPGRCLYLVYYPTYYWCNYSYTNHLYYDVPNGVRTYALGYTNDTQFS